MSDTFTVTDPSGRKIDGRVMNPGDMMDVLSALGERSSNPGLVQYAAVVCSVASIDGVPVPVPTNYQQMRAFGAKLGNDGFAAVAAHLFSDASAAKSGDADADTAKN